MDDYNKYIHVVRLRWMGVYEYGEKSQRGLGTGPGQATHPGPPIRSTNTYC